MHHEVSAHIYAPAADVWRIIVDVERWPTWTASITSVRLLDPGPLHMGTRARIKQPRIPVATWQVTELVEGRSFTWVATGPGVRTAGKHEVEPDGASAKATLTLDQDGAVGNLIARLYRGMTTRYLDLEINGLKNRAEGRQ